MLSICITFGVVPDGFKRGLLFPIIKKSNIDPSAAKSYRPVTISTTFSKLLEIYILEECGEHTFHDLQFGFIENRSTNMAVALTHDVINYCVKRGSTVYSCSLDAESAFDAIPHQIIFEKLMKINPTQ